MVQRKSIHLMLQKKSVREPMFKYLVVVTATVEESLVTLEVEGVNGTALGASVVLQGVVDVEPNSVVGVNGETSAANLSLGEERVDGNRVLNSTKSGNLKRLHVENVDTLKVTEEFESLETSRLVLAARASALIHRPIRFTSFTVFSRLRIPPT